MSKKKALVIDDSTATRFILSKMLTELGYQSVQAKDGKDALERIAEHPDVQVALVDWNMPVMNGLEFIQSMRKDSKYQAVKVLMVTTETEMMQVVRALDAGADEYIMKPFTKEIVADKMRLMGLDAETAASS